MHIMRKMQLKDIPYMQQFAKESSLGLLSLPKNPDLLEKKIKQEKEWHLFVCEDLSSKVVVGCSGIYTHLGCGIPQPFFKIETIKNDKPPPFVNTHTYLTPITISLGPSELCSLFLSKPYRKMRLGELLSFTRLLFIAEHPTLFTEHIVARLRGWVEKKSGISPFWNAIGRLEYEASLEEALLHLEADPEFAQTILPLHPIHQALLQKACRRAIGRTHCNTIPALKMLKKQGFATTSLIDPFDGGPLLQAVLNNIKCIKKKKICIFSPALFSKQKKHFGIVANKNKNFRSTYASIVIHQNQGAVSKEVAEALEIEPGDSFTFTPLRKQ